jgi:hypothetical protein
LCFEREERGRGGGGRIKRFEKTLT